MEIEAILTPKSWFTIIFGLHPRRENLGHVALDKEFKIQEKGLETALS